MVNKKKSNPIFDLFGNGFKELKKQDKRISKGAKKNKNYWR